ncbi:MAG: F0F1 ATP synthase subunit epsilon [Clostridia bacterium]|nr:F0F1 ATP synthase subunit epsilon [Clostridia bacterium]
MADKFKLDIIASDRHFYNGEAEMIVLPGIDGEYGVMSGHEAMITAVVTGEVDITVDGELKTVAVSEGFAEIKPDNVIIIVDSAEWPEEIDIKRAERAKERAEERMRQEQSILEYYHTQAALSRAMNRLRITNKF